MDRPLQLVTMSLIVCGLALVMPSVGFQAFGSPVELVGWQATYSALGLGSQGLVEAVAHPTNEAWRYLGLVLAAAMNVSFVLAAVMLARPTKAKGTLRLLVGFVSLGLVLAVTAPWMPENQTVSVLIGYYVWLLAYGVLLSAVTCAWQRGAAPGGSDTSDQLRVS